MQRINYIYVDEDAINPLLKCRICAKPYIDPIITRDGDRFCRACIFRQTSIVNTSYIDEKSSFLDYLVPIDEKIIHEMLDNIQVKCPDCHDNNLQRKNLQEHLLTQCPKRIVLCKACDLKCPWSGFFDQSDDHIMRCPFEILRPALSEKCGHQTELEDYRRASREQQNEIEQLKKQIVHYEDRTDQLQKDLQVILDLNSQEKERYENLQKDIQIIQENLQQDRFQTAIDELKEQYNELNTLFQQQQQPIVTTSKENLLQSDELENTRRQVQEHLIQTELQMRNHQEQFAHQIQLVQKQELQRKNELLRLREASDQHEIQIRLLARKKCVISTRSTTNTNTRLQALVDTFKSNSYVNLDGKEFDYQDIEYICKIVIGEKKCEKLRMERNDITAKGAAILADALYANTTLTELQLSNNCISDAGAQAFAQVLSIHNWTLTWLELHANQIADEGAEYLADMLKTNKKLILLGLSFNQITDRGVQHLASSIAYFNETLQWLHLASNKGITDASVGCLVDMLTHNRSLQAVWINDCSLSSNGVKQLKKAVEENKNFILEV